MKVITKKNNQVSETKTAPTAKVATKPEGGLKLSEPAVSIGNRGTAALTAKVLPPGINFGENAQLPKSGRDEETAPWLIVRSWISSRPHPFTLQPVSVAIKKGLVKLHKGVTLVQKATGKKFSGDVLLPKGWTPAQAIPQVVAVINSKWPGGRVESKFVNEAPKGGKKVEPRNKAYVGTIQFKAA